jgi:hypothetical protein
MHLANRGRVEAEADIAESSPIADPIKHGRESNQSELKDAKIEKGGAAGD